MEAQLSPSHNVSWQTKLGWFAIIPVTGLVLMMLFIALGLITYQSDHENSIFTGASIAGVELSGLSRTEAEAQLAALPQPVITVADPRTAETWTFTASELGAELDVAATIEQAYNLGRQGEMSDRLQEQFDSWYLGHALSPIIVLDEAKLFATIDDIAQSVGQIPVDATIQISGDDVSFLPSQVGRALDKTDTYERLMIALTAYQSARVQLLIHDSKPRVYDASATAVQLKNILSGPMELYLQSPIDGIDLDRIIISIDNLREWLRISLVEDASGQSNYSIFIDEVALRGWLEQYAAQVAREPERARFYFDDPTQELVLVEPHINGRELDIEATIARFNDQVLTPNRSVPLVINEIVPQVNADSTADSLGITELVAERTTWFYGSTDERKHNIARSASNFYGIVIAPGEEFSFNKYLGEISEADGYKPALIIYGGQTIEGLGGGVCQVSTTLYQTAFWGGFDIGSRVPHAYQVGYYEDGEGTGMDATVFTPLVDFTFTNNTEHHILIENYYNEIYESLTFKIYSTNIGRRVEKSFSYDNVRDSLPNTWEYNPQLDYGAIEQVDWAAEGATVTVERIVYNFADEVRDRDLFTSTYIPWGNVYQYGPGVNPDNLPRDWFDKLDENRGVWNIFAEEEEE